MRFSVWPSPHQSWRDLADLAQHAAHTGWDGIWLADHLMPSAEPLEVPTLECWTSLAALAASVPRIRLGSLVTGNTYRHPSMLAKMAATVDQMSGGRLVLGLGTGWQENEHVAYGIDFFDTATRLARLDETCAVLRSLLTEHRAFFDGKFYRLRDAPFEPRPARLPILIGGGGERVTLRIAARWADEWNTWGSPDLLAAKSAVLDQHCERLGRDPGEIRRSAQVAVFLDGAGSRDIPPVPSITADVGEMQAQLQAYADAGVGEFILPDWNLGLGQARLEAVDRFLTEVAAPFRETPLSG